jgi:hypothetical protein
MQNNHINLEYTNLECSKTIFVIIFRRLGS